MDEGVTPFLIFGLYWHVSFHKLSYFACPATAHFSDHFWESCRQNPIYSSRVVICFDAFEILSIECIMYVLDFNVLSIKFKVTR